MSIKKLHKDINQNRLDVFKILHDSLHKSLVENRIGKGLLNYTTLKNTKILVLVLFILLSLV